jgi:hypothetical protein
MMVMPFLAAARAPSSDRRAVRGRNERCSGL